MKYYLKIMTQLLKLFLVWVCFQACSLRSLSQASKRRPDVSSAPSYCLQTDRFNLRRRQMVRDGVSFVRNGSGLQPGGLRSSCTLSFRLGLALKRPCLVTSSLTANSYTSVGDDVISRVKSKHWPRLENPTADLPHRQPKRVVKRHCFTVVTLWDRNGSPTSQEVKVWALLCNPCEV